MAELELWGGHECTVNRVGDRFFDQSARSGHDRRPEDLDQFAALGLKALRYPVLWERHAPDAPERVDFSWSDARLDRIRALGMRPIVGLVHHGSGPAYTSLLDEAFPVKLAAYARRAADRYGWVRDWTPVNEPLTTARFSALYGHWHPHARDERLFWIALLNQVDGVRLAMREIRRSNPSARLIQTEDVGRTFSTPELADQARFDNTRGWASLDLLFGRLGPSHPLWARLCAFGLERRLRTVLEDPAAPDVVGVNHYVTSDRFLDHRTGLYPPDRIGGNGRQRFADVEAVRALVPGPGGWAETLERVFERYGAPLAVTECHLGCSREEQMRWFLEAVDAALALRARGAPVEGVTAWSLLGAFDWNVLLTREEGRYESGVFDLSGGRARPTGLAALVRALATSAAVPDAAAGAGWWRRDVRFAHPPATRGAEACDPPRSAPPSRTGRPLLILGARGRLGRALARACHWRGLAYVLLDRAEAPLEDEAALEAALRRHGPWAVINGAGYGQVDGAETDVDRCFEVNARGAVRLGRVCARQGSRLVSISSDLVFDGRAQSPYVETAAAAPLNVFGLSKRAAEAGLLAAETGALVIRTAALFSPNDPCEFPEALTRSLRAGRPFEAAEDLVISPTYLPDLVEAVLNLVIDGAEGVWHLANAGARSWSGFAAEVCEALGGDPRLVRPRPWRAFGWAAERPAYTALASARGAPLAPLEEAVERYARALREAGFYPGRFLREPPEEVLGGAGETLEPPFEAPPPGRAARARAPRPEVSATT
jgi:dTDP-4-dehydrorhamnose reductase